MTIRSLVENKTRLDYQALTSALISEFGIPDPVNWEAVIPSTVQQNLFGGETLRLFDDHPNFKAQKDIRTIVLKKGNTSQLLILFAKLKDDKLSKSNIEKVTKKFIGGSAAERFVVWFIGNPSNTAFKVVLSGKEGKRIILKTLPFAINQPYYKTYDFIINEVRNRASGFFVEPTDLWQALWKSFDISVVNKRFYLDIKTSFDALLNDKIFQSAIWIEEARKQFVVRLIGRIIFCWFLKKKDIVSDEVLSASAVNNYDMYYSELLEPLFFGVFNLPKDERQNVPTVIKDYPFLNGGLFEDHLGDYGDYKGNVFINNEWFSFLFSNTLEKYNFTIDENTSSSSEIAIDPEMLGRIFENLLAEQNPDTKDTARKVTGSYYTPRTIVDYMVERSIAEYLKENLNIDNSLTALVDDFIHTETLPDGLKQYSNSILDLLNKVKVLDPACGSGAFPIGMLQKLIALKLQLSLFTKEGNTGRIYDLKLSTILNSIYGCDNQPMAVELSRLRCWLSLIIDEEVDKKKDNWGIEALPNFDFKFVCGDSTVGLTEKEVSTGNVFDKNYDEILRIKEELKAIRQKYFNAKTKRVKEEIRKKDESLFIHLLEMTKINPDFSYNASLIVTFQPYQIGRAAFFDPEWMFGVTDNFDIVIGNPPFVEHKKLKAFRENIKNQNYVTHSGSADLYVYFYERSIKLLKQKGILAFISSNKFFKTNYGALLRDYISKLQTISIVDFTDYHVFDALVASCVYLLRKDKPNQDFIFVNIKEDFQNQNVYSYLEENKIVYPSTLLKEKYWQFDDYSLFEIKYLIEKKGKLIKKIPTVNLYRGITTGYNEAFIIPKSKKDILISISTKNQEIIKNVLQGRNIRKWIYEKSDEYLLLTYYDLDVPKLYPAIFEHLAEYEDSLIPRSDQGVNWWNLRACAYYDEFEKHKIIWGLTADKWAFAYDDKKHYLPSNGYLLTSSEIDLKYILGVLNSSLMQFYFRFVGVMTAGGAFTLKHQTINELPIKVPTAIEERTITNLVNYILFTKNNPDPLKGLYRTEDLGIDELKVQLFEELLNGCVFELYFSEEMKNKEIDILQLVSEIVVNIDKMQPDEARKVINMLYVSVKNPDSKIRNRIMKFETRSPKIILPIINSLK